MNSAESELKHLKAGVIGGAGGVIFLTISVAIMFSAPGDDPPAGLVMVNMLSGIGLLAFWLSGITNILKVLMHSRTYRRSTYAIWGYVLISIPPLFILIGAIS